MPRRPRSDSAPPAPASGAPRRRGRPPLSPEEREKRRLEKNARQRERRRQIREAKDAAREKLARGGVPQSPRNFAVPFEPTPEQRHNVETMAGLGVPHDQIALVIVNPATGAPINDKTLRAHFGRELADGVVKANTKVAQRLYQVATSERPVPGRVTAAIYWTKARMGWRETQHVEVDVKSGVLVAPAGTSPEDWVRAAAQADQGKLEPGGEGEAA